MIDSLPTPAWTVLLVAAKVSLVLTIALFLTRRLKAYRAGARHLIWSVALGAALWVPVGHWAPGIEIPMLSPVGSAADPDRIDGGARVLTIPSAPIDETQGAPQPGSGSIVSSPWFGAGIIYGAGVLAVVLPLWLGMFRASRLKRSATQAVLHPIWQQALQETNDHPRRSIAVLVSDRVHAPVTFGVVRPTILLPEDVSNWSQAHRRNAMVHELEHVARGDWATQLVGTLACAAYWFHPLVWFGTRRLHLEAERACDERVLQVGSDPGDYAQQLVDLTRQHHRNPLRAAVAMASSSELADRVYSVLQTGRNPMASRRLTTLMAVLIALLGVAVASIVPTHAIPDPQSRPEPNQSHSKSSLMHAAREGDVERVRDLIQTGANVDATAGGRYTALILACTYGHTNVVQALLDAGADVNQRVRGNQRDGLQRTALGAAAREGHRNVVKMLLDANVDVDGHGRGDASALMEACEREHQSVAKLLIENGADVNRRVKGDGNAVIAAARGGSLKIMRLLVASGADINAGVAGDGNALIMAVHNRDQPMVEYLLEQGADPNAYVRGDETALVAAAEAGSRRIMGLLLAASEDDQVR